MISSMTTVFLYALCLTGAALSSDVEVAVPVSGAVLTIRQTNAISESDPACLSYSRTANISVIGTNTTYRSFFLQNSKVGTNTDFAMFAAAQAALPPLTKDTGLNQKCGNLTAVAITEAAKNFTMGTVAQFSGLDLVKGSTLPNGIIICIIVGLILVLFTAALGFV